MATKNHKVTKVKTRGGRPLFQGIAFGEVGLGLKEQGLSAVAKCQKKGGKWVKGKCVTSQPASGKETKAMPSSRGYSK